MKIGVDPFDFFRTVDCLFSGTEADDRLVVEADDRLVEDVAVDDFFATDEERAFVDAAAFFFVFWRSAIRDDDREAAPPVGVGVTFVDRSVFRLLRRILPSFVSLTSFLENSNEPKQSIRIVRIYTVIVDRTNKQ